MLRQCQRIRLEPSLGCVTWFFWNVLFSHLCIQMGPSITPLTNLNSGFRVYEVDSAVRSFVPTWRVKSDWLFLDFWNHGCAHVRGDGHVQFHTNQLSLSDGGVMSTRSRASILRSHLAPRTRMNIIRGRPMAAVSAGGVWMIRSMPHGGIGWQKVSLYPCLSKIREIRLTGNTSNGSRFEFGHCKTSFLKGNGPWLTKFLTPADLYHSPRKKLCAHKALHWRLHSCEDLLHAKWVSPHRLAKLQARFRVGAIMISTQGKGIFSICIKARISPFLWE